MAMRVRLGGKIGPVRAGVSVGRRGVGWGAGVGPLSVTGGRSRSRSRSSGGPSDYSDYESTGDSLGPNGGRIVGVGCGAVVYLVVASDASVGAGLLGGFGVVVSIWALGALVMWSDREKKEVPPRLLAAGVLVAALTSLLARQLLDGGWLFSGGRVVHAGSAGTDSLLLAASVVLAGVGFVRKRGALAAAAAGTLAATAGVGLAAGVGKWSTAASLLLLLGDIGAWSALATVVTTAAGPARGPYHRVALVVVSAGVLSALVGQVLGGTQAWMNAAAVVALVVPTVAAGLGVARPTPDLLAWTAAFCAGVLVVAVGSRATAGFLRESPFAYGWLAAVAVCGWLAAKQLLDAAAPATDDAATGLADLAVRARMTQLVALRDAGAITDVEFDAGMKALFPDRRSG